MQFGLFVRIFFISTIDCSGFYLKKKKRFLAGKKVIFVIVSVASPESVIIK